MRSLIVTPIAFPNAFLAKDVTQSTGLFELFRFIRMIWKIPRPSWNSDISLNFRNYLINLVLNTTCLCKGEGWDILNSCQESRKLREDVQFYSKTTMRAATPLCPIQVTTIYYTQCMQATLLLHGRIGGEILGNWQMATV